jgi:hypothetical protein
MSRQELLHKLLDKVEKGNQYIQLQSQINYMPSPPATVRRMTPSSGRSQIQSLKCKGVQYQDKSQAHRNIVSFVMQKSRCKDSQPCSPTKSIAQELRANIELNLSLKDCELGSRTAYSFTTKM